MPRKDRAPSTLADVAARAGVSRGLVSRILNQDQTLTVREETRRAVLDAVAALDYVPSSAARALRTSRTGTLALVVNGLASPIYEPMIDAAQREAASRGYLLVLIDAEEAEGDAEVFRSVIASRRVDGLLVQGGYGEAAKGLLPATKLLPSVIVNAPGTRTAPGVQLEDEKAARLATRHLIDLGHRDVAFVTGLSGITSDRRQRAFQSEMRDAGLTVPRHRVVRGGWSADDCHDAVRAYFGEGRQATGFVVVNTGSAVGVVSALHAEGLDIPREVSVVGIHDTWFAPHLTPALTTVRLPLAELGRRGVAHLINKITAGVDDEVVITDPAPELIMRASSAALRDAP